MSEKRFKNLQEVDEYLEEEIETEKRFTTDYSDFLKNAQTFIKMDNERLTYEEIVDLLNEQQSTISQLETENDNMNLFIKQTIQPLLSDCVFELDTIESMSQVELARKIENEIIPFIQDFKYLKYESLAEENEKLKKQLEIRTASDKYHQRMLTKWLCKNE